MYMYLDFFVKSILITLYLSTTIYSNYHQYLSLQFINVEKSYWIFYFLLKVFKVYKISFRCLWVSLSNVFMTTCLPWCKLQTWKQNKWKSPNLIPIFVNPSKSSDILHQLTLLGAFSGPGRDSPWPNLAVNWNLFEKWRKFDYLKVMTSPVVKWARKFPMMLLMRILNHQLLGNNFSSI